MTMRIDHSRKKQSLLSVDHFIHFQIEVVQSQNRIILDDQTTLGIKMIGFVSCLFLNNQRDKFQRLADQQALIRQFNFR